MTLLHGKSIHLLAPFILLNYFHEPFNAAWFPCFYMQKKLPYYD